MANRSKAKGSRFEVTVRDWLRERLDDDRIDRRALNGAKDMGDIYRLYAHGWEGIAECKDYRNWTQADLIAWLRQTEDERLNACADWALLIVHRRGCGEARTGLNRAYMTLRTLLYLTSMRPQDVPSDDLLDCYVETTLEQACRWITHEEALDD